MPNSETLTQRIEVKKPLTADEKDELLKQISDAREMIEEQTEDLKIHRESVKDICDAQDDIISKCVELYRKGYNSKMVECEVKYSDGETTFFDVNSGEIVEQRPMTETEQLRLTSKFVDAENIIREDSDNEKS